MIYIGDFFISALQISNVSIMVRIKRVIEMVITIPLTLSVNKSNLLSEFCFTSP